MNSELAVSLKSVSAFYGDKKIVDSVTFDVCKKQVVAIIGPSGCGKSTLLRSINRLHEEDLTARTEGSIIFENADILKDKIDPVNLRKKIGMVFQKPTAFPGLSVLENVIAGRLLNGEKKSNLLELAETSLKQASLWDEVKDKLNSPGNSLSGGQQQRLCIARALAVNPSIILMDEPTSALDPISSAKIEDLISEIKTSVTIIIVTHNLQQAARISDQTAFMNKGELIEYNSTKNLFTCPMKKTTESYITGKFS